MSNDNDNYKQNGIKRTRQTKQTRQTEQTDKDEGRKGRSCQTANSLLHTFFFLTLLQAYYFYVSFTYVDEQRTQRFIYIRFYDEQDSYEGNRSKDSIQTILIYLINKTNKKSTKSTANLI